MTPNMCTTDISRAGKVKSRFYVLPVFDGSTNIVMKMTDKEKLLFTNTYVFPCYKSLINGKIGELMCFVHYSIRICY